MVDVGRGGAREGAGRPAIGKALRVKLGDEDLERVERIRDHYTVPDSRGSPRRLTKAEAIRLAIEELAERLDS